MLGSRRSLRALPAPRLAAIATAGAARGQARPPTKGLARARARHGRASAAAAMADAMRRQLCDDAMTMLVLWATRQDYDAVG
jgi:hypothetical protein